MRISAVAALLAAAVLAYAMPSSAATLYVSPEGSNARTGLSWDQSKISIQGAIDAASLGDEIWVAAGAYSETLTMKDGVALYGGFAGSETSRNQRNWRTHVTTIDAEALGSVITMPDGASRSTRIDGFTLKNGESYYGGGIYNPNGSPTIANNLFIKCRASYGAGGAICSQGGSPVITGSTFAWSNAYSGDGGAIYCEDSSITIIGNTFTGSSAANGGAINCTRGNALIAGNIIKDNRAESGAVLCVLDTTDVRMVNNTVVANSSNDSGIWYLNRAHITLSNNIIACNTGGFGMDVSSTIDIRNNCFYQNTRFDFVGVANPIGSNGNIGADPKLVDAAGSDLHIQPDSPCKDTGLNNDADSGWVDMDGESRIQNGNVDMGADESDGIRRTFAPTVIRVSPTGDDNNDGSTWMSAKRTVQAGVDAAAMVGGEIWVAAGIYREQITLPSFAKAYGGFAGTEQVRGERNLAQNITQLDGDLHDGSDSDDVVIIPEGSRFNRLEGFVVCHGCTGIYCGPASAPEIVANRITRNTLPDQALTRSRYMEDPTGPSSDIGYGMGGGIFCDTSSFPSIIGNEIVGNMGDSAGGIYCDEASPWIAGNTIVANITRYGGAIEATNSPQITLINNIVAFNSSGVSLPASNSLVQSNNIYGNIEFNYRGATDPTGTNGNISADPKFASLAYGNLHIQPDSPCRDTGSQSISWQNWLDIDGRTRSSQGTFPDMGADESDGTTWNVSPSIIRVAPTGNDGNDGSSWLNAKRTLLAAIDATMLHGGEIWVAAGAYPQQVRLYPFTYLYGGFAGGETDKSARNWAANPTVLNGQAMDLQYNNTYAGLVVVVASANLSAVDGFSAINGPTGIYCADYASPTIQNNRITGNHYYYDMDHGDGIACQYGSSPLIVGNVIAGNAGGGITSIAGAPVIVNNTIVMNGGSGLALDYCSGTAASNIVAYNASGCSLGGATVTLRSNCVYGNIGFNYQGIDDPTGANGNISTDPGFASIAYGDLHIQPTSPCRNTGSQADISNDWKDMDAQARTLQGGVDIGADESDGTLWSIVPRVIHVSPEGDNSNSGLSWQSAKQDIQAAIDAAAPQGAEIWVRTGVYHESLYLRPFTHLYGGFAGTETDKSQRNWLASPSTIDASAKSAAVSTSVAGSANTIDGFTLTNGTNAVWCASYTAPLIIHNRIIGNANGLSEGAIECGYRSSPTIAANLIAANGGIAVNLQMATPKIINNTLVGNYGALYLYQSSPQISNNIIAFNQMGIDASGEVSPTLRANCIYGNISHNFAGIPDPTGTNGNISIDPKLSGIQFGNLHIQPDSPCRNAGDSSVTLTAGGDIDGQPRIEGARVDIGADESNGTSWSPSLRIVRVAPEGDNANDGSSWMLAKKDIQAGVDAALAEGAEIWVKAGAYTGAVTLRPFAYLYGGFAGDETAREQRDWKTNTSSINGQGANDTIQVLGGNNWTAIDGFALTGGASGIGCYLFASPSIQNNRITGNEATSYQGGITCYQNCAPLIAWNTIEGNSSYYGGGIYCYGSAPQILNNTIRANSALYDGAGIYLGESSALLANNLIVENKTDSGEGGGIYCNGSSPIITNNTIVKNTASSGGGVSCLASSAKLSNNIVASNSSGIYAGGSALPPTFLANNVYGNTASNWMGIGDQTGSNANIAADPLFVSPDTGDYHLQAGSPCMNAGNSAQAQPEWKDLDGQDRIQGSQVDIGADEYQATTTFSTSGKFVKFARWNLVSVPAQPIDPDPLVVFAGVQLGDASFQYWKNESDGGGYVAYGPNDGWFGPITRGTPYWFMEPGTPDSSADKDLSYQGITPSGPFEFTIPAHSGAPFWVMLGTPFADRVPLDSLRFRNVSKRGDVWLDWAQAFSQDDATLRFVDSNLQGWDAANNCYISATPSQFLGESHEMIPWWGYWLLVYDSQELRIQIPKP